MNTEVNKTSRTTRQPLSPLARTAVRTLVGMVMVSGITSLFSRTLVVFTLIALISLVLVARRIRWALLPAALASGALVVYLIQNAAGAYLLLHPKDALSSPVESFTLFVLMVVQRFTVVDHSGISPTRLTALSTRLMLASQGAFHACRFKQRG